MFLPELRNTYEFKWAGIGRTDGRPSVSLDFREKPVKGAEAPEADWIHGEQEECVSVTVPGRTRGRVWADVETGEVLRLDQSIAGYFDVRVPTRGTEPLADTVSDARAIRYLDQISSGQLPRS